ncbi:MAG TPA: amino acid adenylation domain-containing protein [Bryobacteraceae bacterium]|nr:amino acid adenylation domain-containing protein [Bryobacteraceae bacterium]
MTRRLQHFLTQQADRRPECPAVVFQNRAITYAALDQLSNRLARALKNAGCGHGDRVALLLPKSEKAIIAIFAALKADCAYVPLDPASPPARLARLIHVCDPRAVLVSEGTAPLFAQIAASGEIPAQTRTGSLDDGVPAQFTWSEIQSESSAPLDSRNSDSDAAHILFTSGSTGTPKGVVITHSNVIHFIDWALGYFGTQPGDRISAHPPLHFDLSTFDIYGTIAAGAELHLLSPEMSVLPHRLADFIRSSRLTQWFSVPSILHHVAKADALRPNDFPALERLLWCGEKFPTPALVYWMRHLPHVRFYNLYGPTEATIASSYYHVEYRPHHETDEIPIGHACAGEKLLVLDDRLEPTPPDEPGHLYISGVGLSPGYWRDPEKTADVFIEHNGERIYKTGDLARVASDGLVYLLGRADTQIKSRGYRIELGEIESAVHAVSGIRDAAVVAVDTGGFEGVTICCAFVAQLGREVSAPGLRRALARTLPAYMLPSRWLELDHLPLNGNGKVARTALKQRFLEKAAAES